MVLLCLSVTIASSGLSIIFTRDDVRLNLEGGYVFLLSFVIPVRDRPSVGCSMADHMYLKLLREVY